MKYLVDSDCAIHHLRGSQTIAERLTRYAQHGIAISLVSVAELYHGVFRSRDPQRAELNLIQFLSDLQIIGLNDDICRLFGKERSRLQIEQTKIGDFDLLIGCTALHHNLIVLTNNRKDFEKIKTVQFETIP